MRPNPQRRAINPAGLASFVYRSVPVPAAQYVHSQHYRSPKKRFRRGLWLVLACIGVAGIGAAMMIRPGAGKSEAALAPEAQVSRTEAIPTANSVGDVAADSQLASANR